MGGLPSSRLTRILQEKAELLKRQRQTAEQAYHQAEDRVQALEALHIELPETKERATALRALVGRSDWESVETQSKAFLEYVAKNGQPAFAQRRKELFERAEQLRSGGVALVSGADELATRLNDASSSDDWVLSLEPLAEFDGAIRAAEAEFSGQVRSRARALGEWIGASAETQAAVDARLRSELERVQDGRVDEAMRRVGEILSADLPEASARRNRVREAGAALRSTALELGVSREALESALRADAEATPLDWPTTVTAVESASAQVAESLREKVVAAIESLRSTVESLASYGIEANDVLVVLGEAVGAVPGATLQEIPKILQRARAAAEEPVVGLVAGLLDAVRPKLVEARRLGRDATEVFAAMNRAREALRLRIYSEALAASQEAIDRVSALTQDLDTTREEAESLAALLARLRTARFDTGPFDARLERIRDLLHRVELEPARQMLAETLQTLGTQAASAFNDRLGDLESAMATARERGFLPSGTEEDLQRVRRFLEEGQISDAGELLGAIEVRLRTEAGPFVARRVAEIESGFRDIPDEELVAPVRRLLADADVNLRVKEDLVASLDSLKKAEKEFTAVFAAHASSLVEVLEEERRTLEAMGGAGDEIQRQIDEVQQIFNMGDFVKASRASQEIRSRAHQQQLVRSEEAISHAKLALVELGKMGVDAASLRSGLDQAGEAAHAQRFAEAYRTATETQEGAMRLRTRAQSILDELQSANGLVAELAKAGVAVDSYREKIRLAQGAYQAVDLDGAKDGLDVLMALLKAEQANAETRRLLGEAELLVEDAQRLTIPTEGYASRIADGRSGLAEGRSAEALQKARVLQTELVELVRPVLMEHLRTVERDLEVARAANLEIGEITELLGEARRRLALPIPSGVSEILESARTRLVETRGFHEHAERAVRRAEDALREAELAHAAVDTAAERLAAVESALKSRQYAQVISLASALERETLQATYQQVSKTLAGFQGQLVRARRDGTDTAVAENLLQQARQSLEEARPLEALQVAGRSEAELERVELQVRIAQGSLQTIERKLGESESEGVHAPVAREKCEEARNAFRDHLYPLVLELAIDSSDSLALSRENFRRARDALDSADKQVKEGLEFGAEMTEVLDLLAKARAAHAAGEYTDAVRWARDTAERARWAVERMYAGALADVRRLLEVANAAGLTTEVEAVGRAIDGVEVALKARDWRPATEMLRAAREKVSAGLEARYLARLAELGGLYGSDAVPPTPAEDAFRGDARQRAEAERARGDLGAALETLRVEEARLRDVRRAELRSRLAGLKDRLWVGEKLGLDTTPVMELFSEAQLRVDGGALDGIDPLLSQAEEALRALVGGRLETRLRDTQTELVFAQDGLHVALTDVAARLATVPDLLSQGAVIDAGKIVLEATEEIERRKALHRELMNLHYLIDASLGRAGERHLDTTEARKLLDESIRARATDYSAALDKARAALKILQGQLQGSEPAPASGFWPFRRPPGGTP